MDRGDASSVWWTILIEAAETFTEISEPAGSNIVELKWLLKWKGDEHGMVDRAKARLELRAIAR